MAIFHHLKEDNMIWTYQVNRAIAFVLLSGVVIGLSSCTRIQVFQDSSRHYTCFKYEDTLALNIDLNGIHQANYFVLNKKDPSKLQIEGYFTKSNPEMLAYAFIDTSIGRSLITWINISQKFDNDTTEYSDLRVILDNDTVGISNGYVRHTDIKQKYNGPIALIDTRRNMQMRNDRIDANMGLFLYLCQLRIKYNASSSIIPKDSVEILQFDDFPILNIKHQKIEFTEKSRISKRKFFSDVFLPGSRKHQKLLRSLRPYCVLKN
jgi:hypothetical protein